MSERVGAAAAELFDRRAIAGGTVDLRARALPPHGTRAPALAALLIALCSVAVAVLPASTRTHVSPTVPLRARHAPVPLALRGAISTSIGARSPSYTARRVAGRIVAANPAQRLHASFTPAGVEVRSAHAALALSLRAAGYGVALTPVPRTAPVASGNRITYARRALRESYTNGPSGIEQSFTIPRVLSPKPRGPLTLSLAASAGATLRGGVLTVGGPPGLRYAGLSAHDANGRALHSWMALDGRTLVLRIDTHRAAYPVTVDPFFEEEGGALRGPCCVESVAISGDGKTAIVGLEETSETARGGEALVFVVGEEWQRQATIQDPLAQAGDRFGHSVALSANGSTAIIGAPNAERGGDAMIYQRSSGKWALKSYLARPELEPEELAGTTAENEEFGASVALSGDGSTALVGAPADELLNLVPGGASHAGSAWVLRSDSSGEWRSSSADILTAWPEETGPSCSSQESCTRFGEFGFSVALSSDGKSAVVGAPEDIERAGSAIAFSEQGGSWQRAGRLVPGGESGAGELGFSVGLSENGETALAGAPRDGGGTGAAFPFVRSGESYVQQGAKLLPEEGGTEFGRALALSGPGSTALVAGRAASHLAAVWELERSGSAWSRTSRVFSENGVTFPVGLSSSGARAVIHGGGFGVDARIYEQRTVPPEVQLFIVSARRHSSATLEARIKPEGEVTSCRFEYGTEFSSGPLASSAPCSPSPAPGDRYDLVTASLTGLTPSTKYYYRAVATNAAGTGKSLTAEFETTSGAPIAGEPRTSATPGTETAPVEAAVDPEGTEVTSCAFEYRESTTSTYHSTPCSSLPGSGEGKVTVSATLTGLRPGATTYAVRLTATNAIGTAHSPENAFITGEVPPLAETGAATSVTGSSATLNGTVTPNGSLHECKFEYGPTTSYGTIVGCSKWPPMGPEPAAISSPISGLAPGVYHYRLVVSNFVGGAQGADRQFTAASAPSAVTGSASAVTNSTATLNASVNPNGATVSECVFQYGTTTAYGSSAPCSSLPGSGGSPVAVSAPITTLAPSTGYHFRIVAASAEGTSAGADQTFTTEPLPAVSAISPLKGSAAGGTAVTITGAGFSGASAVAFGSTPATSFEVLSSTSIRALTPAEVAGKVDVRVTVAGATSAITRADHFSFVPQVTGLTPSAGPTTGGNSVTVTGAGFAPGSGTTMLKFGTALATSVACPSQTECTALAPAHAAGKVTVKAIVNKLASPKTAGSSYTFVTPPSVTAISPSDGPEAGGTSITITGSNLSGASAVSFGAVPAKSFTVLSATQISAVSPPGSGQADVAVTTAGGTSSSVAGDRFSYIAPPSISALVPREGPEAGGAAVTITGTHLATTSVVKFGASAAPSFSCGESECTATTPAGSGTVDVTLTTVGGSTSPSPADRYIYVPRPAVTSVTPASGPEAGETPVVIEGANFTGASSVHFGSSAAKSFTVVSATQISAVSPAGTGTVDVTVTTTGGTSATGSADRFTYLALPGPMSAPGASSLPPF
jgi:hypothetical protein